MTPAQQSAVVTVQNLSKKFCTRFRTSLWYGLRDIAAEAWPVRRTGDARLRPSEFWSLRDVSFELRRGEALAVIGANGAGKSTLLKLLHGLIKPDAGSIRMRGRVGALIELGVGLDPLLTGRENIFLRAALLGVPRAQVLPVLPAIIEFTGLGDAITMPVQFYSSGMVSRLAYAVAAHLHPDVLLVDEVLAVGDFNFQRKCVNHMMRYLAGGGSLILVSHQPHHIQSVCQRGIVLEKGRLVFDGSATEALDHYFAQQIAETAGTGEAGRDAVVLSETQPVTIEQVELTGHGLSVQAGDDVTVTLTGRSWREIEGVSWSFFIYTAAGDVCLTGAYQPHPITLKAGRNTLSCRLRRFPLTAGHYTVRATIFDMNTLQPLAIRGWEDAPSQLRVEAAPSVEKNVHKMLQQLMTVEAEWNQ